MPGETDLTTLLAHLEPRQRPGRFAIVATTAVPDGLVPSAVVVEDEGITVVVPAEVASAAGWVVEPAFAWITLRVHSSLEAVGLTAAVSAALAARGIPANVLAGWHHDHVLVPEHRAADALEALRALSKEAIPPGSR